VEREYAGAVSQFEDELGLGPADDAVGCHVLQCQVAQGFGVFHGDVLVILETPANPTLELVDIAGVVAQADGVPVLVDNTFATPVLQNPTVLGATKSLRSATKYLGGHGDVVAGVIACDEQTASRLRQVRAVTGGLLHPLGGYLLHRGLTTLPTRIRTQQLGAQRIAAWLADHAAVDRVYYPGLDGDPRGLLEHQMHGTGAMVAAALTHRPVAAAARPSANLVRLSVGLEHVDDLIADLNHALGRSASTSTLKLPDRDLAWMS
jgi:methionine-gamma-lyase